MAHFLMDQNLLLFVGSMVLPWDNLQIITHMEMDLDNPLTKHSSKSSNKQYMIVRRIGTKN
jgi:hypothetical protein